MPTNGVFYAIVMKTRNYAAFGVLFNLFISSNGRKRVPDAIFDLLNEIALAHWIMGDGSLTSQGALLLCTDSFTIVDVVKLMNVLNIKWGVNSTIQYYSNKPRIYIPRKELMKIKHLVAPHMCPSFLYKIK